MHGLSTINQTESHLLVKILKKQRNFFKIRHWVLIHQVGYTRKPLYQTSKIKGRSTTEYSLLPSYEIDPLLSQIYFDVNNDKVTKGHYDVFL